MKRKLFALLSLFVLASMVLAACGGGATATEAPVVTEEPAAPPTEAPPPAATEPPAAAFEGTSVAAESCDYGGEFKSIEAVDATTVKFTLCYPDPAFLSKVAFAAFAIQDGDYLTEMGGDSAKLSEAPNGTGPYLVKEWVRGDHITYSMKTETFQVSSNASSTDTPPQRVRAVLQPKPKVDEPAPPAQDMLRTTPDKTLTSPE